VKLRLAFCLVFAAAATPGLLAAIHQADSLSAFKAHLEAAAPGDTIVLKNGVYTTTSAITVRRAGEPGQPITLAAESVGGVEITGTHGFNVVSPAAHIVISGFKFTHAAGKNSIGAGTTHVRFTRNIFQCTGEGAYLAVSGDDAQVDYNEFRDKKTVGNMLSVMGTGSQVARRLWVHHNYFHDFTSSASPPATGWSNTTSSRAAGEKTN
jgi:poly(beta-D-mannuronate) lyase